MILHQDRVSLGIYRSTPNVLANTPSEEATISEFAEMLRLGGTDVTIVPEIQRVKFLKNIWNSVIGPVAVLSRDTPSAIFRPQTSVSQADGTIHWMTDSATPPSGPSQVKDVTADMPYSHPAIRENTIPFLRDAFTEVVNLGNTVFPPTPDGPALNPELAFNILKNTSIIFSKPTSTERPSMLVDVELGRPMELEVVVGEVVRLGRKFGVDMPVCSSIPLKISRVLISRHDTCNTALGNVLRVVVSYSKAVFTRKGKNVKIEYMNKSRASATILR